MTRAVDSSQSRNLAMVLDGNISPYALESKLIEIEMGSMDTDPALLRKILDYARERHPVAYAEKIAKYPSPMPSLNDLYELHDIVSTRELQLQELYGDE